MSYFDIHLHPSTKAYLSHHKQHKRTSCWKQVEAHLIIDEWYLNGDRLDSQSCLQQIIDGKVALGVVPLHAFEREFAETGTFRWINFFSSKLSNRLLRRIRKYKIGYFQMITEELDLLERAITEGSGKFELLSSAPNASQLNQHFQALVSIEGAHSFLETEKIDSFTHADTPPVLQRFNKLISDNPHMRLAFLTLTHISRNPFATQAFSYARDKEKRTGERFLPRDPGGIQPAGWDLINECLNHSKPVLIDVKHLSLRGRIEYYQFLKDNHPNVPIIASHMGCTGYTLESIQSKWEKKGKFYQAHRIKVPRAKGLMDARFYPLTLNLLDEEVKLIVESKGIIGISLDERILGFKKTKRNRTWDMDHEGDYFNDEDLDFIENYSAAQHQGLFNYNPPALPFESKPGSMSLEDLDERGDLAEIQMYYYCNNILKLVYAGGQNTWKHICIGSDFDGLIDAIEDAKTATRMPHLRNKIKSYLLKMMKTVDQYEQLFHADASNLDQDVENKLDDLFFNNGFEFLKRNY